MNPDTEPFYLRALQNAGIDRADTVLVVCGGDLDRNVLMKSGISNATISNLDSPSEEPDYSPYRWERQDAENLDFPDASFDWVVAHAGLHHCGSPHRGVCEMLRVSRKGIIAVESRDSLLMRVAIKLGLTTEYEFAAVAVSNGTRGGLRATPIPNRVHRWTEREVINTTNNFVPDLVLQHRFMYGYRFPFKRVAIERSAKRRAMIVMLSNFKWLLEKLLPRQGNQFAFVVTRTGETKPWIKMDETGTRVDLEYIKGMYDTQRR